MTRRTNARIAGIAYLLYIAVAFPAMVISNRATAGTDMGARLTTLAQHVGDMRLAVVLSMIGCFCALILAVTLYAITRVQDRDLALLGLTCRVAEGIVGAASLPATLALVSAVWTGTAGTEAAGAIVLNQPMLIAATFFAVGSTIFSWLLLKGHMVPRWIATLGVIASALAAVAMPLQILDLYGGIATQLIWLPVAAFEISLAIWFIVRGVNTPVGVPDE